MPSITARFSSPLASPLARAIVQAALYLAILGAAVVVSDVIEAAPPEFIYQRF